VQGKVVVVHAPAVQHELYVELFIEILEKARVVALYGVVIEIAAVIFTFAPFVESRLCDVDVAPRESVRPTVVPRVSSGAVAGIISVIGGRVALHDLLVVIISRYDFVRVFPVPFLVAGVESVPANVVRLLDLDVDGAVLARGSSENVGLFILGDRISFVNGVNVSYPLSRAGHLIKILILVIHDCLFALFLLFLSLLTFILLSLLLCLLLLFLFIGFAHILRQNRLQMPLVTSFLLKQLSVIIFMVNVKSPLSAILVIIVIAFVLMHRSKHFVCGVLVG
jgi:hypothetical protein